MMMAMEILKRGEVPGIQIADATTSNSHMVRHYLNRLEPGGRHIEVEIRRAILGYFNGSTMGHSC